MATNVRVPAERTEETYATVVATDTSEPHATYASYTGLVPAFFALLHRFPSLVDRMRMTSTVLSHS